MEPKSHSFERVTVSGLWVFPVKSCAGIALQKTRLARRGLPFDREWMVVDGAGRFLTQREHPRLALIRPELGADWLSLTTEGSAPLRAALAPVPDGRRERQVVVWRDTCRAWDEGDAAAAWLRAHLGVDARLVRMHRDHRRLSVVEWTDGLLAENGFTDGFPILVISEESLADLNTRVEGPALPMIQFRPNLVIAGGGAYLEDRVRSLQAPGLELCLVKPCARCRISTTNQRTAAVGVEPLRALASYRRNEYLGGVMFGQNVIVARGVGEMLRVGMTLEAAPRRPTMVGPMGPQVSRNDSIEEPRMDGKGRE